MNWEKIVDNKVAYFLILEKIFDVESDLCDQMRRFFISFLPRLLRSDYKIRTTLVSCWNFFQLHSFFSQHNSSSYSTSGIFPHVFEFNINTAFERLRQFKVATGWFLFVNSYLKLKLVHLFFNSQLIIK